jgi:hypothetical protein
LSHQQRHGRNRQPASKVIMTSKLRSVLSQELTAKLAALGTQLGPSDRELENVLAELAALSPHLIVRASREIAQAAGLRWWPSSKSPSLEWHFGSLAYRHGLLRKNPEFAWLFLFDGNGYVREAALNALNSPPSSSFFFSALAWRLNDWVLAVRQAAQRCTERVLHRTAADVAATAALYLLSRRLAWGRWSDEAKALDKVFERKDVMAGIALQLALQPTGPRATLLRHALRYPAIDEYLPSIASTGIQPSVRAVAYTCLISGNAAWTVGFEWAWIDKVYGLRRRVPKLETRQIQRTNSVADVIKEAIRDKSNVVRIVAADGLIAARSQLPDAEELITRLARLTIEVRRSGSALTSCCDIPFQGRHRDPVAHTAVRRALSRRNRDSPLE